MWKMDILTSILAVLAIVIVLVFNGSSCTNLTTYNLISTSTSTIKNGVEVSLATTKSPENQKVSFLKLKNQRMFAKMCCNIR